MECSRTQWRLKQRCGNQTGVLEPYYDIVNDQESVHNVRIHPAKPMNEEREYADRDLLRSSSAQSLSSVLVTSTSKIHPTYPPRKTTPNPAPAIHRDLKPGRRKNRTGDQLQSMHHKRPPSRRCPPSPALPLELVEQLTALTLQDNCRRERLRAAENVSQLTLYPKGSSSKSVFSPTFDVDSQDQHVAERCSNRDIERVKLQRRHHEWPQTQEEIDQHDFVPMEKPQTYWEDDWYIGACSRTDAEHALHLVNKDGAFLVRDCSLNSNSEPLVLTVYHEKKVYNVKIRFIENLKKYALGNGQRSNEMFDSVVDIIKFHSIFPIVLICGKSLPGLKCQENCVLVCPVTKRDVERLLR